MFFFFNDTATTEIYTLSLHDALPILPLVQRLYAIDPMNKNTLAKLFGAWQLLGKKDSVLHRSEEHTSELQSQSNLVCRLLLEKKKKKRNSRQFSPEVPRASQHGAVPH